MREGTVLLNHAQKNLLNIDTRSMACRSHFVLAIELPETVGHAGLHIALARTCEPRLPE